MLTMFQTVSCIKMDCINPNNDANTTEGPNSSKNYFTNEGLNAIISSQLNAMISKYISSMSIQTGHPPSSCYPPEELIKSWRSSLATLSQFTGSMYGVLGSSLEVSSTGMSVPGGSATSSLPALGGICASSFPISASGLGNERAQSKPSASSATSVATEVDLFGFPSSAGVSTTLRLENDKTEMVASDLLGQAVMSSGLTTNTSLDPRNVDGGKLEVVTSLDKEVDAEVKSTAEVHESEEKVEVSCPMQHINSFDVLKTSLDPTPTSEVPITSTDVSKVASLASKSNSAESTEESGLEPGELPSSKTGGVVLDEISDSELPKTPSKDQLGKDESVRFEKSLKNVTQKYEKKRQEDRRKYPPYLPHQSAPKRVRESFANDRPFPPPRRHSVGRPATTVTSARDRFHRPGSSSRDGYSQHVSSARDYRHSQCSRTENSSALEHSKSGYTNNSVLHKFENVGSKLETSFKSELSKSDPRVGKPVPSRKLTDKELLEEDLALSDEDFILPSVPTPPPTPTAPCDPAFSLKVLDAVPMQAHQVYVEALGLPVQFK